MTVARRLIRLSACSLLAVSLAACNTSQSAADLSEEAYRTLVNMTGYQAGLLGAIAGTSLHSTGDPLAPLCNSPDLSYLGCTAICENASPPTFAILDCGAVPSTNYTADGVPLVNSTGLVPVGCGTRDPEGIQQNGPTSIRIEVDSTRQVLRSIWDLNWTLFKLVWSGNVLGYGTNFDNRQTRVEGSLVLERSGIDNPIGTATDIWQVVCSATANDSTTVTTDIRAQLTPQSDPTLTALDCATFLVPRTQNLGCGDGKPRPPN